MEVRQMKKALSLLLALVMCLSLCACASSNLLADYSGKWVYENGTTTYYLYEDGTFKEESTNSLNGDEEYQGTWEIKNGEIVVHRLKMVKGTNDHFDKNGNIIEGFRYNTAYKIIDLFTLEDVIGQKLHKEVS
jgi:uncharacterized lipoprotein YehR (DUF1307 family)